MNKSTNKTIKEAIKSYNQGPPPSRGNGQWVQHPDFDETRRLLGRSFAGTDTVSGNPETEWATLHLQAKGNHWYTSEQHQQTISFVLGIPLYGYFKRTPLIVSRRMTDSDERELASAAIVLEYNKKHENQIMTNLLHGWYTAVAFLKLMFTGGLPDLLRKSPYRKQAKHFERKGHLLHNTLEETHKKNGPNEAHWYVALVGVGPEHKGKGYGGELMRRVGDLADEAGVLCYLECGTPNKPFYEKMGYQEYSKHTLEDPVDPIGPSYDIYTMVRRPRPPIREEAH